MDEGDVMAWPWLKLQRWIVHDEVDYMLKAVGRSSPGITEADAMRIIAWEQERCGWRGVYRAGSEPEPEDRR